MILFTTLISVMKAFKQNSNDYCVTKKKARKLFSQHWNKLLPCHPEFSNYNFSNEKGRETTIKDLLNHVKEAESFAFHAKVITSMMLTWGHDKEIQSWLKINISLYICYVLKFPYYFITVIIIIGKARFSRECRHFKVRFHNTYLLDIALPKNPMSGRWLEASMRQKQGTSKS